MAFKNEVVSDEDIDRYNLPFPKGGGRWWTRDAERDYYLWGGIVGNPAFDDMRQGRFNLYVDGVNYWVKVSLGECSMSFNDIPYILIWQSIIGLDPSNSPPEKRERILQILKEALRVYGLEGQDDEWVVDTKVIFEF